MIILTDFEFAISQEVEQNLWKIGFYKVSLSYFLKQLNKNYLQSIEEYRKTIKKVRMRFSPVNLDWPFPVVRYCDS